MYLYKVCMHIQIKFITKFSIFFNIIVTKYLIPKKYINLLQNRLQLIMTMMFCFPSHPSRAWVFSHNGIWQIGLWTAVGLTWCLERTCLLGDDGGCSRMKRHQALWVDTCLLLRRLISWNGGSLAANKHVSVTYATSLSN